jgi:hypothetical protein
MTFITTTMTRDREGAIKLFLFGSIAEPGGKEEVEPKCHTPHAYIHPSP